MIGSGTEMIECRRALIVAREILVPEQMTILRTHTDSAVSISVCDSRQLRYRTNTATHAGIQHASPQCRVEALEFQPVTLLVTSARAAFATIRVR